MRRLTSSRWRLGRSATAALPTRAIKISAGTLAVAVALTHAFQAHAQTEAGVVVQSEEDEWLAAVQAEGKAAATDDFEARWHSGFGAGIGLGISENRTEQTGERQLNLFDGSKNLPWEKHNDWRRIGLPGTGNGGGVDFRFGNRSVEVRLGLSANAEFGSANFKDRFSGGPRNVWLTVREENLLTSGDRLTLRLGQFGARYGKGTEYGRIVSAFDNRGETLDYEFPLQAEEKTRLLMAQGLHVSPAGGSPIVGYSSWVAHHHLELKFDRDHSIGLHTGYARSQDDNAPSAPYLSRDGVITHTAIEGHATLPAGLGRITGGAHQTRLRNARFVGNVVQINQVWGGPGLMQYFIGQGSEGTGTVYTATGQYDLSMSELLEVSDVLGEPGSDVRLSFFSEHSWIRSRDRSRHGTRKLKAGGKLTLQAFEWAYVDFRLDSVQPIVSLPEQSFEVYSALVELQPRWRRRPRVRMYYAYGNYGSKVESARGGKGDLLEHTVMLSVAYGFSSD